MVNSLVFFANGAWSQNNGTQISWTRSGAVTGDIPSPAQDVYTASMINAIFTHAPGGTFSLGGDPWVIATADVPPPAVPEPASVVTGLIGVVGAIYTFRRRRTA